MRTERERNFADSFESVRFQGEESCKLNQVDVLL